MSLNNQETAYQANLTGDECEHYLGGEMMPIAKVAIPKFETYPVNGDLVQVGGEFFYFCQDPAGFEYGRLCRTAQRTDYGGNVYFSQDAPESTTGILKRGSAGAIPTEVSYTNAKYWLKTIES